MKKTIPLFIAAAALVSCSTQDNSGNTAQSENVTFTDVSNIYDGYEDLQGKEYSAFTMPEKIIPLEAEHIYSLECNSQDSDISDEDAIEMIRYFFGDEYDESYLTIDENAVNYVYNNMYTYVEPKCSGFEKSACFFSDGFCKEMFYVGKQGDESFTLLDNEYNVADEAEKIDTYLNDLLSAYLPDYYKLETKEMYTYDSDDNSVLCFRCCYMYDGVPFQYEISEYSEQYEEEENYWASMDVRGQINSDGDIYFVIADGFYNVVEETELDSVLSLVGAVDILAEELAEYSGYEFVDVSLMYTSYITQPVLWVSEDGDNTEMEKKAAEFSAEIKTFEPYWCFELKRSDDIDPNTQPKKYIKVNAVTGEVFIDFKTYS